MNNHHTRQGLEECYIIFIRIAIIMIISWPHQQTTTKDQTSRVDFVI